MKDHLRICILSFYFSPLVGGAETQSERQARQLQALGNDVTVITLRADKRWKRTEMLDCLPVVRVGGIYRNNGYLRVGRLGIWPCSIAMFLTLWRLRHQFDVIHAFQITPLAAAAVLIGKITHKPVVIGLQSTGPDEMLAKQLEQNTMLMAETLIDRSMLKIDFKHVVTGDITYLPRVTLGGNLILNFLRNSNAFYQVNSTRSYSYMISHGFRADRIVSIPHGVDTETFRADPKQVPNPANPERNIICVARLDFAKGVDVLLQAWGRMMHAPDNWRKHLKPRLFLVGDGGLREQLERITIQLGMQDSVEFLGLRRDVVDLLQRSWGYVQPSRWESLPNALLEAMACGLPCIATRVSGCEDIIVDGTNGLLVEPERPDEMAMALRRILENNDIPQKLGQRGRITVVRGYQLIAVVEQYLELYHRALKKSKSQIDEIGQSQGTSCGIVNYDYRSGRSSDE